MKRYIKASWNGVYSLRFLMRNCDKIQNKEEAKIMQDYMYQEHYDDGFRNQSDILDAGWCNLDEIYDKAMRRVGK